MKTLELCERETLPTPASETHLRFPLGIPGFERAKEYILSSNLAEDPFQWLQMRDDSSLAFLVVPPFLAVPDYQPALSPEDVEYLELDTPEDALLLTIVTLRGHGRATVNLKGPILINRHTRRAKQVVLANAADYALQFPLPLAN